MKRPYLSSPTRVCLFLTHRCNFRCKYCYVNAGDSDTSNELSLDEIRTILDEIQMMNVLRLRLYGGEPLLRPDIQDMLDLLSHYHFAKQLNTNGFLITREMAELLKRAKVGWVIVSLNGPKMVHEKLCGVPGSYEKVLNGIQELVRQRIRVGVDFVLTSQNVNHFHETLQISKDLNVNVFRILPLSFVGRAKEEMETEGLTYDEWKKFYLMLTDLKTQGKLNQPKVVISDSDCNPCTWHRYYPLPTDQREELLRTAWGIDLDNFRQNQSKLHCIGGISLCAILADGDVYPCDQMIGVEALKAGNVRDQKLNEIWYNSAVFKMLRNLDKRDLHGPCSICENEFCSGLNLGAAYCATGDFLGSDMNCIMAKELS